MQCFGSPQFAGFSRLPPASPEAVMYDLCGFSRPASPKSSFQQSLGCNLQLVNQRFGSGKLMPDGLTTITVESINI